MPFHNSVYYPYSSDTQGTHSSAGIPSLLNSPAPGMTPSSGAASAVLPFKFRPRRESVDWRRISAVDVELVMSQLNVDALQEHISTVAFCSLEAERCQRCQTPLDPALVKLMQLAQLTVEWLLHCQEFLTVHLHAAEKKLEAAGREREQLLAAAERQREQLLAQQKKQKEKVKAMTAELEHRKELIRTQQSLFASRISGLKCLHCEKSFMNSSFLQSHMQRRHPDQYDLQLCSDSEKKSQMETLKLQIISLKEQVVQQQQELQAKTAQEMDRMDRKIADSRDGMRREMEFLYTRNIQALNEANLNQIAKQDKAASPVSSQPERDLDYNYKEIQAIQKREEQMKEQVKKLENTLQDLKAERASEKNQLLNELLRKQSSLSEHEEHSRRQLQEMGRQLQEKEQTIRAQREQMRNISSCPPIKVVEAPVVCSAPPPEPKPKRVVVEELVCALRLDPIQELSEEEKDSSSFSEKRPVETKPTPESKLRAPPSAPKRNINSMKKDLQAHIQQAFVTRLENLGVKPDQSGLKNEQFTSTLARLLPKRESLKKGKPDYLPLREEITRTMEQKLSRSRSVDPAAESPAPSRQAVQVLQIRPRSSSLPSRATRVICGPAVKQPKTPQPAPRTKTTSQPKTSTPITKTTQRNSSTKTPPFSSDEQSEEEDTDTEEEQPQKHQRGKAQQSRLSQGTPVQTRASPGLPRQGPVRHQVSSNPQPARASVAAVTRTAVTKIESEEEEEEEEEEEWSEISELQEIDPGQIHRHKDQNGNVDKRVFGKENKINDLAKTIEKQFAGRAGKKPAGGVSILPGRKDEVQELTYTDLEESSEWVTSSLEDRQEVSKPAQGSGPIRKSLDSPSTSVWGSSTGKGPKPGLNEAGSTLKSTLYSLSDISDSEDISNKHYR